MLAKFILGALAIVFLTLGVARLGAVPPRRAQARVWLLIGALFGGVSLWLFVSTP